MDMVDLGGHRGHGAEDQGMTRDLRFPHAVRQVGPVRQVRQSRKTIHRVTVMVFNSSDTITQTPLLRSLEMAFLYRI